MLVSLNYPEFLLRRQNGYYYSLKNIKNNFQKYCAQRNLSFVENSPKADIAFFLNSDTSIFDIANYDCLCKISLQQFETKNQSLPPKQITTHFDEYWPANTWGKSTWIVNGINQNQIHIYPHGVEPEYQHSVLRGQASKVRFLHIDSTSLRKNAYMVLNSFLDAFGPDNPNVEMTFKHTGRVSNDNWGDDCQLAFGGEWVSKSIRHIWDTVSIFDLVKIIQYHDVLVFPTSGEGFGLIPLNCLATGMPVISTGRWCGYKQYIEPFVIGSEMVEEKSVYEWSDSDGFIEQPNADLLRTMMLQIFADIDKWAQRFYSQAETIWKSYNWERTTFTMLDLLMERL